MKHIFIITGKKVFYILYFLWGFLYIHIVYHFAFHRGQLRYLNREDYRVWKRAMLSLLAEHCRECYGFQTRLVHEAFATAKIQDVRVRQGDEGAGPIVVLCVRNDLQRLQMLVSHYRSAGVTKFAFLDNGSTDGTYEWMLEQEDIDIYRTFDPYKSLVKEAWINRIVSHYGFEKWYILTDSDELCTYIGMEEHPFPELLRYAEVHGIRRFKGLNLDMYADAPLYSVDSGTVDIRKTFCWMDSDSYEEVPRQVGGSTITAVIGGPRKRVMGVSPSIMKYPLVFFEKGTVSANAHFQYPYKKIPEGEAVIGILHYKFLNEDKLEYRRRSQKKSGFSMGRKNGYYRLYVKCAEQGVSFMYDGSVRYVDSMSLEMIPLIHRIEFKRR